MSIVEKNKVIQFHYSLKDINSGDVLEKTDITPMAYLHGYKNIMPTLEEALSGKRVNDHCSVAIAAAQAYGVRQEGLTQRVPVKHLQGAKKWRKGMVAVVQTEQGQRQVTITKLGKFMADVDFNHPYAGKDVTFDVNIIDIRDATAEEIAHGHAHGVGGHHH